MAWMFTAFSVIHLDAAGRLSLRVLYEEQERA